MSTSLADHRPFWLVCNGILLLLHAVGIVVCIVNGLSHPIATLWFIILMIHCFEIPLAFVLLRGNHGVNSTTKSVMTLLFGFTWWVPMRRGLYHG